MDRGVGDRHALHRIETLFRLHDGDLAPVARHREAAALRRIVGTLGRLGTLEAKGIPGDVDALAERLQRLRDDPELRTRFAETGRIRMRERFSTKRMLDDVERVYAEILAR